MMRAVGRVALQVWIVLFIIFFGAEVVHLEPTLRVLTQTLFGVPLVVWALLRLRGPVDRLDWLVLAALLVYALVCLFSRDRTESVGSLGLVAAYAAWFLLVRRAGELRETIVLAAATGLALTLAFNAYLLVQEKVSWYATLGGAPFEGRMTFPWESVNALPVLVLVAIPFVAWLDGPRLRTILGLVVVVSAVVVVPLSLGRAGWLGLAVALVFVLLLMPMRVRLMTRLRRRTQLAGAAVASLTLLAVLALSWPRLVDGISESGRLLLWSQAVGMVTTSPLFGFGPGTYSWTRLEFGPPGADLLAVRLIHNVPLQTLVDGGIVLVGGMVAVAATWAITLWRSRRAWSASDRVAIACLVGMLAVSTLDDFSYLPAITAAALTLAALLTPARRTGGGSRRWMMPAAMSFLAAIAVPSVIAIDVARAAGQAGRTAMVDGEYGEAAAAFEAAARSHPEIGGYWLGLGMAHSYLDEVSSSTNAYRRAQAAAPGDPRAHAALAALTDDAAQARALLRVAASQTLGHSQYALRLGWNFFDEGDIAAAVAAWGEATSLYPGVLRDIPFDAPGIEMHRVAEAGLQVLADNPRPAPSRTDEIRWDIGLAVDELPSDAAPAWQAIADARRGDHRRASTLARAAITATPYDARGYLALAAVATYACDRATVESVLDLVSRAFGSPRPATTGPEIRREFVYREAGLGPTQPSGVTDETRVDPWPWSLVPMPIRCAT